MKKSYIWSLPTRVFHFLLALFTIIAFLLHEEDYFLTIHVAFGAVVGYFLILRVIWGFMNIKYSKFKDFNFGLNDLKEYMLNVFSSKKEYAGHNPASSFVIVGMIIFGLLSAISGFLVYGVQEGRGVFAFLNIELFRDMELFEELHEIVVNVLMLLIGAHVAGVVLDKLLHKKNSALDSMINGYKNINVDSVKLTIFQKIFGFLWVVGGVALLVYILATPKNVFLANSNIEIDYQKKHKEFYDECISCHTLYPPFLLPKASWEKVMDNLEDHFGDDASLEDDVKESIKAYLLKNAAENSTKESAYKGLKSIGDKDIIAYTDSEFWKKRHEEIDKEIFKAKNIKSKANCKACHLNIEKGIIEDENIKIPKQKI